jgi:hypothetical protein
MNRKHYHFLIKNAAAVVVVGLATFSVACAQIETQRLISEMNANRAKCQELTRQAEAKRAVARRQNDLGQTLERKKSIEEAANLYGQISKLLNESADKGDKVVALTTTDWYKEYFTVYSKWTRNLAKLAAGAREELLVKNNGQPTDAQTKKWRDDIAAINKEDDAFVKQIAKLEADHHTTLVAHD